MELGRVTRNEAHLLFELTRDVTRVADKVTELAKFFNAAPCDGGQTPLRNIEPRAQPEISLEAVEWLIKARQRRQKFLPPELFGEPAWDILLDLLRAELAQHRVAVSSLCVAASVPATTGLRWIAQMVEKQLLVRQRDKWDGRRVFIELSPNVSSALRSYFADIFSDSRLEHPPLLPIFNRPFDGDA